jgi:hypothetical protein
MVSTSFVFRDATAEDMPRPEDFAIVTIAV